MLYFVRLFVLSVGMILFFSFESHTQTDVTVNLEWLAPIAATRNGASFEIPQLKDQGYEYNRLIFQQSFPLVSGQDYDSKLSKVYTIEASKVDQAYLKRENIVIPSTLDYTLNVKNAAEKKFGVLYLFPFVLENGQVKKVQRVDLQFTPKAKINKIVAKSFAANSVLATGTWYKIAITDDGMYKIDKNFLEACGFSTTNLNPNHIHIFGNGEGMLPEDNDVFRTDDLANNAIEVVGGADGSFDAGDYILFYGFGPHRWVANGTVDFVRKTNIYSDVSNYFITINSAIAPNRVQLENSLPNPPTDFATTTNFRLQYELDVRNLVQGGQRWYGDVYDSELSRTYNFSIPDVEKNDPQLATRIRVAMATNLQANDTNNRLKLYLNNALIDDKKIFNSGQDFTRTERVTTALPTSDNLAVRLDLIRTAPSTVGYLDYITINANRTLRFFGSQINFRNLYSVGTGKVTRFALQNANANVQVWDVTSKQNPRKIAGQLAGQELSFTLATNNLREFTAFSGSEFYIPTRVGGVANQNLHALAQTDYIIVTHPNFVAEATRLANLHRGNGLEVHVVTPGPIYNEFSSGSQDITAIRQFVKMFYDRGMANGTKLPKYLLLFGDGVYDPKGRASSENYILTYQVVNSEDHIASLVSDDYFAFLDDNEGFNVNDLMDIGVGRLLISSNQIATEQVDKIEHYMKNGSNFFQNPGDCDCAPEKSKVTFGDWRTKYVQIADDEEKGYFIIQDTEPQNVIVNNTRKEMNADKIYLDAFRQVSTAGGQRYPDVVDAINDRIRRGALVINYVGHGGEVGVAEERVITVPQIQNWKNNNALSLLVTATCEFTKYDDPNRVSAGEWASLNPQGGAIALMTTTRSVYFTVNSATGKSFFKEVFKRDNDSLPLPFGTILQNTKNGLGSISDNKRSFTLIGDPALRIAMPRLNMKMDSIYREGSSNQLDTVRALDKITVVGHVEDTYGVIQTGFNGIASPTIYDKPKRFYTLSQDEDSPVLPFDLQKNALYKGQASIVNGYFKMTFIVPKDIDYSYGQGKVSLYGNNATIDAFGADTRPIIGGSNPLGLADNLGPEIELYMNDERFVDGGITDETPLFIAKVRDDNGINAVGNGIGHDITAILDENTSSPYILNEYYLANLDDFTSGEVKYNMPELDAGEHTLTFKVWDVNNNSSQSVIRFIVKEKEKPELSHVLNYPNPFTTRTSFFFEHNQVNTELESQIQIFTVSGKLVKTINTLVNTVGFRTEGIEWDGKDDFGDQLAKGVYVYRVSIKTDEGLRAEKFEKLVILK